MTEPDRLEGISPFPSQKIPGSERDVPYTIRDVLIKNRSPDVPELPAPPYSGDIKDTRSRVGLAVESMKRHMTDEGWQLFAGLAQNGYVLHGADLGPNLTDVREILKREDPGVVVVQDQREWDGITADCSRDPRMRFKEVEALAERDDVFKLTIVKDCQHNPPYHRDSARTMGVHAWICYYHPRVVKQLAPYVRPRHLIRTYHTVCKSLVPSFSPQNRKGCLLSGALSSAYPLRVRLSRHARHLPDTTLLKHPGYHRKGSNTPEFLRTLSGFRVAVCTASVYGYALRKIIEATACGCVVLTDLPRDDVLPEIDGNLARIRPDWDVSRVAEAIRHLVETYDSERQEHFAKLACSRYDYVNETSRLRVEIERARLFYPEEGPR